MPSFAIGDIVSLKSGGAKMTVEYVSKDSVGCVWSDGKKTIRDSFLPATLAKGASIEELSEQLENIKRQPPQLNVNFVSPKK